MTEIVVTGGTGVLGREVVRRLTDANVRVLSRRENPELPAGVRGVRGDLRTGDGLADALDGIDVIVHCASNGGFGDARADVGATRRLLTAAKASSGAGQGPHLVYISIVGVDLVPYGYYQAKLAAETLVRDSGLPWTILRATQFHDLALALASVLCAGPVVPAPTGMRSDLVDAGEVAQRLADLALGEPAGRVPDMGGPQTLSIRDVERAYLDATGRRRPIVPLPLRGKVAAAFRAGGNLLDDGVRGTRTFTEYLADRKRDGGGRLTSPYRLRGR